MATVYMYFRVSHSLSSIIKPKSESQKAAQREIDEAMKKVREAQSLITAAADSGMFIAYMSHLVGKPTMWFPNRSDTNRTVQA